VARALAEPRSPDARFEERSAADYIEEARTTFEELGLRWDLQQLEQAERAVS
jgi:hypothetical protein